MWRSLNIAAFLILRTKLWHLIFTANISEIIREARLRLLWYYVVRKTCSNENMEVVSEWPLKLKGWKIRTDVERCHMYRDTKKT